ncbi:MULTISPECIES: phospho-N-acetylmuramoyl-pentapeptide-transferase [Prochlorococcus]|uniref:phospho-N-acetylmuramoyl-pentapeptide- transferase n=1 Tax=Prochlorococcus sp. MIT 0601 TaxID=1499498 RepID=UPI0005337521|nr:MULTISPECIES: phospho-N-acetylmuramoyl-pentapeptide-transferase [Prochlorococcus]KGG13749.1 Phospho-N-acetylmuramoyl-pentapeptide-transferase [Prochlorococcus sp. MIT 0601]
MLSSYLITKLSLKKFQDLKLNQVIKKEGPKKHQAKKGTPTMGGLITIPIGLLVGNIASNNSLISNKLIAVTLLTIAFMGIGFIDDWKGFILHKNAGLTPIGKISLQLGSGIIFLLWAQSESAIDSSIKLFNNYSIDFGILIWPIALFLLIAESNATNLTDGLDGLASGCGAIIFTGLSIQFILEGTNESFALSSFCIAISGAWLGFLLLNQHPANIFMGDTGSLAMGAALIGIGLISNTLWPIFIMGIVFFAESLSVILQVIIFKCTKAITGEGHRIFLMAPLHHHFELSGLKEVKVVRGFWLITICFVVLSFLINTNN